jgi:hypothetical protein
VLHVPLLQLAHNVLRITTCLERVVMHAVQDLQVLEELLLHVQVKNFIVINLLIFI